MNSNIFQHVPMKKNGEKSTNPDRRWRNIKQAIGISACDAVATKIILAIAKIFAEKIEYFSKGT